MQGHQNHWGEGYMPVTWLKADDLYTCSDGAHLPPPVRAAGTSS